MEVELLSPQLIWPLMVSPVCAAQLIVAVTRPPIFTAVGIPVSEHPTAPAATTEMFAALSGFGKVPATLKVSLTEGTIVCVPATE
jgi:hypothetical protein